MITIDFNRLNIKPGYRILDIGCGEGRHTAKAWEFPGVVCVGADMSHKDLLTSSEKLKFHEAFMKELEGAHETNRCDDNSSLSGKSEAESHINGSVWTLSVADITSLPFPDATFDIIICSEVMEHIPNERGAFNELKRILNPNGTLALSVPRYWPEKLCWMLSSEYSRTPGGHIRIYRKNRLLNKALQTGFESASSHHYAHSLHSPYWWLKCWLGINRTDSKLINLYHALLVWDLIKHPFITRFAEKILNPLMGKSVVYYFRKRPYLLQ